MNKFIYIAPQIVGTAEKWETQFDMDPEIIFDTPEDARDAGYAEFEHDDFWVGEVRDGKVIELYIPSRNLSPLDGGRGQSRIAQINKVLSQS